MRVSMFDDMKLPTMECFSDRMTCGSIRDICLFFLRWARCGSRVSVSLIVGAVFNSRRARQRADIRVASAPRNAARDDLRSRRFARFPDLPGRLRAGALEAVLQRGKRPSGFL